MISTIDESLSLEKCPALVLNADYRRHVLVAM